MNAQRKPKSAAAKWQETICQASAGNHSQMGCIFLATCGEEVRAALRDRFNLSRCPEFASSATVTSDGFLMAGFTDKNGEYHMGALVGDVADFRRNVIGLADHAKLKGGDRELYLQQMRDWIKLDYRANKELF